MNLTMSITDAQSISLGYKNLDHRMLLASKSLWARGIS